MPHDFEIEPGLTLGEWIHREIAAVCIIETDGWAPEAVARIAARLQPGRSEEERLEVVVPWFREMSAFTAPGRYIYFGRRLLERCGEEEMIAFVIAHEIAHHDLGHLALVPRWMGRFARRHGGAIVSITYRALERRLYGPERECDADRHAIDLCLAAGYDGERCLEFFRIMEQIALDLGDRDIVFGPDPGSDAELDAEAPWHTKAQIWAWQRTRGYLPLQDRAGLLRRYLADKRAA